jgi:hypothetical protein
MNIATAPSAATAENIKVSRAIIIEKRVITDPLYPNGRD